MNILHFISNQIRGQLNNLQILFELLILLPKASKAYETSIKETFLRAYELARKHHFRAHEAFDLGLYDPDIDASELIANVSKRRLSREQAKVNPKSWFWVTEHKDVFYQFCKRLDIPTPKLHAIYYKNSSGWALDSDAPYDENSWLQCIKEHFPETFVIKPINGVHGKDIKIYTRKDQAFTDTNNASYSPEALLRTMQTDGKYNAFVIQERLVNHPDLKRLSDNNYLQTLRVNSFVDRTGKCRIVFSVLKLITGNSITDNFAGGATGNLIAQVDVTEGKIYQLYGPSKSGKGYAVVTEHDKITIPEDGYQIPLWAELCDTIEKAALQFVPVRSLGWDVAITPTGPVIIEANIRWDPIFSNIFLETNNIIKIMQQE